MDINQLIAIVKKKIESEIEIEDIFIEDKSYLHKNHPNNQKDKFHLKVTVKSNQLLKMKKIESNKRIYKILDNEIKKFIHSIQILIN